jgi:hypothetical protein
MNDAADKTSRGDAARAAAPGWGLGHFIVAALILGVAAAGWSVAVEVMHLATQKVAVPWPADVKVDEEFRMVSLPERFGPYQVVDRDGEIFRDKGGKTDGKPDGEIVITEDVMAQLKIGTSTDRENRALRRSNWYAARIYRDNRVPAGQPLRYWRLEVYYYTGGVDVVPHVPDICLVAGGATLLSSRDVEIPVPSAPGAWGRKPVRFRRVLFQKTDYSGNTSRFVQYYAFSLNGTPESSRNVVRLRLTSPFVRHAYFAKIQFGSLSAVRDSAEADAAADAAAREFTTYFLPQVLEALPTPEDVEKLEAGAGGGRQPAAR